MTEQKKSASRDAALVFSWIGWPVLIFGVGLGTGQGWVSRGELGAWTLFVSLGISLTAVGFMAALFYWGTLAGRR